MAGQWVKLYRESRDHPVFQDPFMWKMFCWCLMRANYTPQRFFGELIDAGEFVTSMETAADSLNCNKTTVFRGLHKLADDDYGCVRLRLMQKAKRKYTVVSVINWRLYQHAESESETGEQTGTQRACNGDATGKQQIKELKNERREEVNTPITPSGDGVAAKTPAKPKFDPASLLIPENLNTPEFRTAWSNWIEHRKEKKSPITKTSGEANLRQMQKWGVARSVAAIEHTILKGWTGLREDDSNTGRTANRRAGPGQLFDSASQQSGGVADGW